VSHAEVEGHSGEEAQPRGLIEVFPGKLAELILEFLWRVNALLYQKSIHRINCRPETLFARESLHRLIEAGKLFGYHHDGFWACMDTFKEKQQLDDMVQSGSPPWQVWDSLNLEAAPPQLGVRTGKLKLLVVLGGSAACVICPSWR